jgi:hypothetical protein
LQRVHVIIECVCHEFHYVLRCWRYCSMEMKGDHMEEMDTIYNCTV